MNSQPAANETALADLQQCAALLAEKLQDNDYEQASELITSLTESRDKHIFESVGNLTRALHNSIVNFNVDGGKAAGDDSDDGSICDASSHLEYVINITQNAADKTMDMVEECAPISTDLNEQAIVLKKDWARFKNREMSPDEFRELYDRFDVFFEKLDIGTSKLNENLQNIILEQGFQDLTGQVLKRIISLVTEVETNLVSLVKIASQVEDVVGIEASNEDKQNKKDDGPDIAGEGPQIKAAERDDVVSSQDEVDDLLSSLGF